MQRKILTFTNEHGQVEDLIPYVDAMAIQIGGTNLVDYLAQIEDNIERALLYLGAYESEEALLNKHPNGSDLKEGSYAIVTDEDALYIYDTDGKRWLKTASATIGILQLNGLTPINGSLTITGGDIKSTVSNAETSTQTITNHLDTLYAKNNELEPIKNGTIATYTSDNGYANGSYSVAYKITVNAKYKDCEYIYFKMSGLPSGSSIDKTKTLTLEVTYSDGTVLNNTLYSSNMAQLTLNKLDAYLGIKDNGDIKAILVKKGNGRFEAINVETNETHPIIKTIALSTMNWVDNEEGTGYKYVVNAPVSSFTSSYNVLAVSKQVGALYTTAIVDYSISNNVITIFSDTKFNGKLTYLYRMG